MPLFFVSRSTTTKNGSEICGREVSIKSMEMESHGWSGIGS